MNNTMVCSTCGDRYKKLGYQVAWFTYDQGYVGDCNICKHRARLYPMRKIEGVKPGQELDTRGNK